MFSYQLLTNWATPRRTGSGGIVFQGQSNLSIVYLIFFRSFWRRWPRNLFLGILYPSSSKLGYPNFPSSGQPGVSLPSIGSLVIVFRCCLCARTDMAL